MADEKKTEAKDDKIKKTEETEQKDSQEIKKGTKEKMGKKETKAIVSPKLEKIIQEIEKLTVLELADLVKALEDEFGVCATPTTISAPVATQAPTQQGETREQITEQTIFNMVLSAAGANKIAVIKAVREIVPSLGLQDAKTLVESAPKEVLTGVNKKDAQDAKKILEAAGATVELK